ncbi:MAG: phosphate-binding protein, partial [Methylicorpusculum sp.]|nr:phosphate-binding protein [Methylicorpusculum sp.]
MKFDKYTQISGFFLAMLAAQANALPVVDPGIPEYQRVGGISGNLSSVGSDTLGSLMTLWAQEFRRVYPNVNIQFQSLGSSSASPALSE